MLCVLVSVFEHVEQECDVLPVEHIRSPDMLWAVVPAMPCPDEVWLLAITAGAWPVPAVIACVTRGRD